jgi:hypothetical protein
MTGLQMSQPRPVPKRVMISLKVRSSLTMTAVKSCARDIATCSHSAVDRVTPALAISAPMIFFTSGMHEPHEVPARVQALTAATSWHWWSVTASRTAPTVTLLHEQTAASAGRSACGRAAPAFSGSSHSPGSAPNSAPTIGRSEAYADASPTRTPPRSVRASSVTTSFL